MIFVTDTMPHHCLRLKDSRYFKETYLPQISRAACTVKPVNNDHPESHPGTFRTKSPYEQRPPHFGLK